MNRVFLQTYYSLLLYCVFKAAPSFITKIPSRTPEYVMFAYPLNLLNVPLWIHSLIFLIGLFFCLLCIFYPYKYLRIITSALFLIIFSIKYSYGKIDHLYHIWMISSALMCFFLLDQVLRSRTNLFVLRLTQGILLSHYFISGLWKIRSLIASKFDFSLQEISMEYISSSLARNRIETNILLNILLYQIPALLAFGFCCILVFQMTALLPLVLGRFFIFYGILAILFHLASGIALGIYFTSTILAVLFFLIVAEIMIKNDPHHKSHKLRKK